jgi:hypothetical protein
MLTLKLTGDYFFVNQLESLQRTELSNEVYIAENQPIILLLRPRKLSHESVDCNRRPKSGKFERKAGNEKLTRVGGVSVAREYSENLFGVTVSR